MKIVYSNPNSVQAPRIDAYLHEILPELSRSYLQKCIKEGQVRINDLPCKPSALLQPGDFVVYEIPELKDPSIEAEEIPLDIVYEDADLLVVNKPKGMVVHPAHGHYSGTLVNALMHHCRDSLSGINGELRPGIVHRIDKDTTGLLVVCKNDRTHRLIARQLEAHNMGRVYVALVHGLIGNDEGTIEGSIGRSRTDRKKMAVCGANEGKPAITHYKVLERFPDAGGGHSMTLIECRLETGRTHQIRVHMAHIGHPVAGDELYGVKKDPFKGQGQYLHAAELNFLHPVDQKQLCLKAELPEYFRDSLERLRKRNQG